MKKIKSRKNLLTQLCLTSIVLFMIFHVTLLIVLDFNVFSDNHHYDFRNNIFYLISYYGIAISLIGVLVISVIKSIWMCQSVSYVKNMLLPFVMSLIVEILYCNTNLYLQKDFILYTALICLTLSFTLLLIFIIISILNYRVEKDYQIGKKIYKDFIIIDIILLVVVLLGGFKALDYARGNMSLGILVTMVFMSPALAILEVWGVIMYLIYRIKKED